MSNRPVRGSLPGGGGWVPGQKMPPLGFGVVPQQPTGTTAPQPPQPHLSTLPPMAHPAPSHFTWHHHQMIATQQMGMAGSPVGVQSLTQPQPQQQSQQHFQRFPQYPAQQQQWAEAQRKAVEEQRKFYEQMMKQRQFDEQKMRLKSFNAFKKGGVSADTMIEHIMGSKDTTKQRSPQLLKKTPGGGSESQRLPQQYRQGAALDWSKMDHMNRLFTPPQVTQSPPQGGAPVPHPSSDPAHQTLSTPTDPSHPPQDPNTPNIQTNPMENKNLLENKKPVVLPDWLSDTANQPEIYQRAVGLVGGEDGWVDTSRAHMLLLRTGLPPQLLGLLWELANCTRLGQLTQKEFTALLGLVALVQTGQAVTGREVLSGLTEPVLPILDHPALLPLVQDYINHRQQLQQQQLQQQQQQQQQQENTQGSNGTQNPVQPLGQPNAAATESKSDDEFDDFVSVGGPGGASNTGAGINITANPMLTAGFPPLGVTQPPLLNPPTVMPGQPPLLPPAPLPQPPTQTLRPGIPSIEKAKAMNLPKVGHSPEVSPTASFDHAGDDDFDDFQSAGVSGGASSAFTGFVSSSEQNASSSNASSIMPLKPKKSDSGDKYAVFRELEETPETQSSFSLTQATGNESKTTIDADDSFGDFCSSEPVADSQTTEFTSSFPQSSIVNPTASSFPAAASFPPILSSATTGSGTNSTSPLSFEVYSTPPEVLPESNVEGYFEADFGSAFEKPAAKSSDNYADIHEAMKRAEEEQRRKNETSWNDPFGEFEEASSVGAGNISLTTGSAHVPQLSVDTGNTVDDDFGDFMGPGVGGGSGSGGGDLGVGELPAGQSQLLGLSENMAETQSVASLELPGLEVTVEVDCGSGGGSNQSPDLSLHSRGDSGVEDQLRGLSLDASSGGTHKSGGPFSDPAQPSPPSLDTTYPGGLVDRYSSIRDQSDKSEHDEAHTGSWERCLAGCVGLLSPAADTLTTLNTSQQHLTSQVLATSQMMEYLADIREVWRVCERIASSSQQVTTTARVDQLLAEATSLWARISQVAHEALDKGERSDGERSQLGEGEVCGVCLSGGGTGGGRLVYGGHCYHPPCANLWLNCVDILLPSLTPVTLL